MKNLMEGSKSRLDTTEGMIHELEYRPEENMQTSIQYKKMKSLGNTEKSLRDKGAQCKHLCN